MTDEQYLDSLRERIAKILKWLPQDTVPFSLRNLARMVRSRDQELHDEIVKFVEERRPIYLKERPRR